LLQVTVNISTFAFLRRVLPDTGFYVAAHKMPVEKPDAKGVWQPLLNDDGSPLIRHQHPAFATIDDLEVFMKNRDGKASWKRKPTGGGDVWFSPASYREARPVRADRLGGAPRAQHARVIENVLAIKTLWLDLDVDANNAAKYKSLAQAGAGLATFLAHKAAEPFGEPEIIVKSGGGLHAYWVLDKALPVDLWRVLNGDFTAALRSAKIPFDKGVVSNPATLLRPVGTHNFKYQPPRLVSALYMKESK
jgi:hypothetical protein